MSRPQACSAVVQFTVFSWMSKTKTAYLHRELKALCSKITGSRSSSSVDPHCLSVRLATPVLKQTVSQSSVEVVFFFRMIRFYLHTQRRWIATCQCFWLLFFFFSSGRGTDLTAGLNYRRRHNCWRAAPVRAYVRAFAAPWLELSIIDDVLMRSIKPYFSRLWAAEADNAVMTY